MKKQIDDKIKILGIGITGQCPTYMPTGKGMKSIGRSMIYQDNRAVEIADALEKEIGSLLVHQISGHSIWAFYILPKFLWQRKHQPELSEQISLILQPTDYIGYLLTNELATDETHANATLLYDLRGKSWHRGLMERFGVSSELVPKRVLKPWDVLGTISPETSRLTGLETGIPVVLGAADSQCNCLGTGAVDPDVISEMSGTSSCLNSAVREPLPDCRIGHYSHVLPDMFCTEMGLNTTGGAVDWFAGRVLGWQTNRFLRADALAKEARKTLDRCIFLPYLSDGERDDPTIKGGFYGLSMAVEPHDMMMSVFEGVACAIRKRKEILENCGCNFKAMHISGGCSLSNQWNQIKADVLQIQVKAIQNSDGAELGAAMLAGIGIGVFKNAKEAIDHFVPPGQYYDPNLAEKDYYAELYAKFLDIESGMRSVPLRKDGVS
jgi:sugar (pentulose or hexulose) kinase